MNIDEKINKYLGESRYKPTTKIEKAIWDKFEYRHSNEGRYCHSCEYFQFGKDHQENNISQPECTNTRIRSALKNILKNGEPFLPSPNDTCNQWMKQ